MREKLTLVPRANDVRRLQQRWISRKTRGENLDAFAPRLDCKNGDFALDLIAKSVSKCAARDLTANDNSQAS